MVLANSSGGFTAGHSLAGQQRPAERFNEASFPGLIKIFVSSTSSLNNILAARDPRSFHFAVLLQHQVSAHGYVLQYVCSLSVSMYFNETTRFLIFWILLITLDLREWL